MLTTKVLPDFCLHDSAVRNLHLCAQGTPSLEELKLQYYRLYIQYYQQEHNYLEICRCYRAIYDTHSVLADPSQWQPVHILEPCASNLLMILTRRILVLPCSACSCVRGHHQHRSDY